MTDRLLYETIEAMNYDYLVLKESEEFRFGKRIIQGWHLCKQFHFLKLLRKIFIESYYVNKFLSLPTDRSPPIIVHAPPLEKKTVVFTCISELYDAVKEPYVSEPNVDYILYTDQEKTDQNSVWQYRKIPEKVLALSDNGKIHNEYIRTHPYEFFPEYDYAIYLDGSLKIMSDVSSMTSLISPSVGLAMHRHSICACVYKEGRRNILWKRGRAEGLKAQMAQYRSEGVPKNMGRLLEGTVVVTDLNHPIQQKIYELWWDDFCRWNSQRNQVSIPYILWKLKIPLDEVGTLGGNVWRNPKFRYQPHKTAQYMR